MKWSLVVGAGSVLGAQACADSISAAAEGTTDIIITVPQDVYRWSDISAGDGMVISAELANEGDRAYVARLGDGFNSADEQSLLFVASGSDAYFERAEPSGWVAVERAILIEGVRDVTLVPGSKYSLLTYVLNDELTGVFRLRVEYTAGDGAGSDPFEAVSEQFEIR